MSRPFWLVTGHHLPRLAAPATYWLWGDIPACFSVAAPPRRCYSSPPIHGSIYGSFFKDDGMFYAYS